ncbi:glycoside hydrolase family 43 protein [Micromonospora sp. NPDC049836]|uniref:glycoside hydrolase family 43 protein n=1 Tax=Micromonospora sp. NPDC049836 TaxID=3364274 RepID=UPI0037A71EFF
MHSRRIVRAVAGATAVTALVGCDSGTTGQPTARSATADGPLVEHIHTADPSGHVWAGRLYVYPSHDVDTGVPPDRLGSQYDMRDYHVLSMAQVGGEVVDHGVALALADIPWADRQLWAPDAARKGDRYYLFFPAKDRDGIFRIGVATSADPAGPFVAEPEPIAGSQSIDPAVFTDEDGTTYLYQGGILGGQLQRWRNGAYVGTDTYPANDEPALGPRVARLTDDLLGLAEPVREVVVLDEAGRPLRQGDPRRFFEGSWVHRRAGRYYLMYSTGESRQLAWATGDSPYGPFTYGGTVLEPVDGWTTQGSIVEVGGDWYLLYHDASRSGVDHLRDVRIAPLEYDQDGGIRTVPR